MDPLSVTLNLVTILQFTGVIISYLKDVKDAPRERLDLLESLAGLRALLGTLQERVEQANPSEAWFNGIVNIAVPSGPLDQLTGAMKRVEKKLSPGEGSGSVLKRLTWRFDKSDVKDLLVKIEHTKSLILLALQNDHLLSARYLFLRS